MPRGFKTCVECQGSNGPRAFDCKHCGAPFVVKTKKRRKRKMWEECNWRELRVGDIIKVKSGSGPFWSNIITGEMQLMGVYGVFVVNKIYPDGIGAYPHKNKAHSGYCFIYMGKRKYNETTGIERRPHKIKKFIPKEVGISA